MTTVVKDSLAVNLLVFEKYNYLYEKCFMKFLVAFDQTVVLCISKCAIEAGELIYVKMLVRTLAIIDSKRQVPQKC